MDIIVTTAIVGTGQAGNQGITTSTPVDALAAQLSCEPERQLLLAAGAWAMYRRAGRVAGAAPEAPPPAESETLADCSRRVKQIIDDTLLQNEDDLLLEALARMRNAGLRLPYDFLPQVLQRGAEKKALRAALVPVLGTRGHWLSQFNPAWSWVAQYLAETTQALPTDAETIWQEGTQGQRAEILQRLRQSDPAKARTWLVEVWKLEKAEARNDFLATMETQLSMEDEPFLEQALDDRSSNVRATAASFLARLPESALTRRMRARANAILSYTNNELVVTLPEEIDQAWERDGIISNSDNIQGKRTTWMTKVLAQVPPQHWEEQFGLTPQQLLDAAVQTHWVLELIESWSYATLLHRSAHWIAPLVDWWDGSQPDSQLTLAGIEAKAKSSFARQHKASLLALLPQREAEQKVLQLRESGEEWMPAAVALPKPWSEEFGHTCLQIMRDYLHSLNKDSDYGYEWVNFLKGMEMALPPACFAAALQSWEIPDVKQWIVSYWKRELTAFEAYIRLKKRILEEI
ncbi:hypothetical protein KSF_062750 [Reticulibacter mediterranei]|uniref:Uncharacterized protein n=1 Tax=Reticulibacter mediterranei TaxID=2778369 RepID=A0A8J3N6L1_9CHLR|nr:DUF5691 domain-containing protein [Reticulibacter mediterranei]GHO96227.1 hypothetical protein KSF_062750 [Reticulibacter mediterranei]